MSREQYCQLIKDFATLKGISEKQALSILIGVIKAFHESLRKDN